MRRPVGRDDRQRRLGVAPVEGQVEVGGLGLGRQSGGRAAALDVDHEEGQLEADGQADRLALERQARSARGGHAEVPGEGRAQRGADRGDLVLGLQRAHAEVLVLGQLVQDVGGRRDRVAAQEHGQVGLLPGRHQAPRERGVAGDLRVLAGRQVGPLDLVLVVEDLGGLAEVPPGLERGAVGRPHELVAGEAVVDPGQHLVDRPGVDPADQAQREEVLGPVGVAGLDPERDRRLLRERGHRHLDHAVAAQRVVGQGVVGVAGLLQVALVEGVGVDDERPALLHPVQLVAQGGGVHGDEDVGRVTRRRDVVVGDVDLEGRHPGQRPRRGPDLGRELGQRGQVVAQPGADAGEPVSGQLHAVAGVPGEADHHCAE